MQSGRIRDGQISASSQYGTSHAANQGRLHLQASATLHGSWSAEKNDAHPWLQVYLGSDSIAITGVATQGRNGCCPQWVLKYNLQYGDDNVKFWYYREPGESIKVTKVTLIKITDVLSKGAVLLKAYHLYYFPCIRRLRPSGSENLTVLQKRQDNNLFL